MRERGAPHPRLRQPAPPDLETAVPDDQLTTMRRCVLDGARLGDAAAVCVALAEAFRLSRSCRASLDALREALGEYDGEPVAVVWRNAARSATLLGPRFAEIVSVLQDAAAQGRLTLELA